MAAAPPSAAGAEASGAGVAKASVVCTHPSREVEEEKTDEKEISQEIRQRAAGMLKDKSLGKAAGKANAAYRCKEH